ncbi:hypothetical protein A6R68_19915, partial [Neotoma lepida]
TTTPVESYLDYEAQKPGQMAEDELELPGTRRETPSKALRQKQVLYKMHPSARFLKLEVDKTFRLSEASMHQNLSHTSISKDGKAHDYAVGFTDLGNSALFFIEDLGQRLDCAEMF